MTTFNLPMSCDMIWACSRSDITTYKHKTGAYHCDHQQRPLNLWYGAHGCLCYGIFRTFFNGVSNLCSSQHYFSSSCFEYCRWIFLFWALIFATDIRSEVFITDTRGERLASTAINYTDAISYTERPALQHDCLMIDEQKLSYLSLYKCWRKTDTAA